MSNEMAVQGVSMPALWEPPKTEAARQELQSVLLNSTFPGAKPEMVQEVISYCAARQIDPLLKPVHIVPMWNAAAGKMIDTIMPGIYLYRILAARTGEYAGKTYPEWGPVRRETLGGQPVVYPEWCRMKVFRRVGGVLCEFGAEEWWLENYAQKGKSPAPNQMWAKRSRGQLAKCVEAQALRMAFPEAFGGTMTLEEMEGKMDAPAHKDIIDAEAEDIPSQRNNNPDISLDDRARGLADCFISDVKAAVNRQELENITGGDRAVKLRNYLRKRLPDLAADVDKVVQEKLASFEAEQPKEQQKQAQKAESSDDLEVPPWV